MTIKITHYLINHHLLSFANLICASLLIFGCTIQTTAQTAFTGMRDINGLEITAEMAPGINLFNTLDAVCWWCNDPIGLDSETVWGNPFTTPEMVQSMADRGFKSIRIPVTWFNHMGAAPDYTIDEAWMDRVEEVANYAFDADLYVIINIHHDDLKDDQKGSWLMPTNEKKASVTDQIQKIWTQIATRFKDYGDYLIFETMNEPREVGAPHEWTSGTAENREVINALNLAAVNAIRATGGNNAERFVMIPQYAASFTAAKESLIIPNDDDKIIVSVHNYSPFNFTLNTEGTPRWGSPEEIETLQNEINSFADHYIKNGQAVIIGEWGAGNKENYADRIIYYDIFATACKEAGITPFAWFYEFNRNTLTWEYPLMEEAIIHAFSAAVIDIEEILLNISADTLVIGDSVQLAATIMPNTATSQDVVWSTFNEEKATINAEGWVKALKGGNVKITATGIGKTATFNLFVVDSVARTQFNFEAEDFDNQEGIQTESTTDDDGGENIGHIENGDWSSYSLSISSAGIYDFIVRAATATNGGTIEISVNDNVVGTVNIDGNKSSGWQDWFTTTPTELQFEEGHYNIKLTYKGSSGFLFNLNWFELDFNRSTIVTSLKDDIANDLGFQVFPNPFTDTLHFKYNVSASTNIDIQVIDVHGSVVESVMRESHKIPGNYAFSWENTRLLNGMYFVRIVTNQGIATKKLWLNK